MMKSKKVKRYYLVISGIDTQDPISYQKHYNRLNEFISDFRDKNGKRDLIRCCIKKGTDLWKYAGLSDKQKKGHRYIFDSMVRYAFKLSKLMEPSENILKGLDSFTTSGSVRAVITTSGNCYRIWITPVSGWNSIVTFWIPKKEVENEKKNLSGAVEFIRPNRSILNPATRGSLGEIPGLIEEMKRAEKTRFVELSEDYAWELLQIAKKALKE